MGGCGSQGSTKKQPVRDLDLEIYFKKPAHAIVEVGKSKFGRAGWQEEDPGES